MLAEELWLEVLTVGEEQKSVDVLTAGELVLERPVEIVHYLKD